MGFALRNGLSFCRIGDRVIFLDVSKDRYFCLGGAASEVFQALDCRSEAIAPKSPLNRLIAEGILRETEVSVPPRPCSALPVSGTLLEACVARAARKETFEALRRRFQAEIGLRLIGLERTLSRLSNTANKTPPVSLEAAAQASRAFAAAALWRTRQRNCLSISLATMRWLLRRGGAARLVIGVKLQPFQAHCWVQADRLLINDVPDVIRNFTPILVV